MGYSLETMIEIERIVKELKEMLQMNNKEIINDIDELKVILRMIRDRLNVCKEIYIDIDMLTTLGDELCRYSDYIQDGINDLAKSK